MSRPLNITHSEAARAILAMWRLPQTAEIGCHAPTIHDVHTRGDNLRNAAIRALRINARGAMYPDDYNFIWEVRTGRIELPEGCTLNV